MPAGPPTVGGTGPDEPLIRTGYALDGSSGSIAEARQHAVAFLEGVSARHGVPVSARAVDVTRLVVSELVTNALKYAPGPALIELRVTGDSVEVVVWDSHPALPAAWEADPARIGRHGLEIVAAVAESLSVEQQPVGKRVTARIALTDVPG